jgi:hypothetical protein
MATYSNNEGYKWAPTYFNGDLCRYLGVSPHKQHYKSFLLKKLMQKLELKYGRYQLDDDIYNILKDNDVYVGWYKQASKSCLSRYLTKLRSNTMTNSTFLVLKMYEEGDELQTLSI